MTLPDVFDKMRRINAHFPLYSGVYAQNGANLSGKYRPCSRKKQYTPFPVSWIAAIIREMYLFSFTLPRGGTRLCKNNSCVRYLFQSTLRVGATYAMIYRKIHRNISTHAPRGERSFCTLDTFFHTLNSSPSIIFSLAFFR